MYCHVIILSYNWFSDTAKSSENMEQNDGDDEEYDDEEDDDDANDDDDDTRLNHCSPDSKKQKIQN